MNFCSFSDIFLKLFQVFIIWAVTYTFAQNSGFELQILINAAKFFSFFLIPSSLHILTKVFYSVGTIWANNIIIRSWLTNKYFYKSMLVIFYFGAWAENLWNIKLLLAKLSGWDKLCVVMINCGCRHNIGKITPDAHK